MRVITIGINHAGTTFVRTLSHLAKTNNQSIEIIGYDSNDNISFLGCGIALWVGNEIQKPDGLFYATPELLEKENIKVNMQHQLLSIDANKKTVEIKDLKTGKIFIDKYDKLVLGIGSWPLFFPVSGLKDDAGNLSKRVHIVKTFQHAKELKSVVVDDNIKNIAVVGAGYIGIELVEAFSKANKKVTLIDVQDRIMPLYYDREFTSDVEVLMKEAGVDVQVGQSVKEFKKNDKGEVVKVITINKDKNIEKEYDVDLVLWAAGFSPQTEMLKGILKLGHKGSIKTNEYFQTSNPDIYAIGDCVEVQNNALHEKANIALATTAVRTGIVTAYSIMHEINDNFKKQVNTIKSLGFQGANAISVFGQKMASVGLSETAAKLMKKDIEVVFLEDNDRLEFLDTYKKVKIKIVWDKVTRKILGAQISSQANHTEVIYMFSLAILKGLTIDELPLVDIFFLPHFNKPYNFVTLAGLKALGLSYFQKTANNKDKEE